MTLSPDTRLWRAGAPHAVTLSPDTRLSRRQLAEALTNAGYRIAEKTLATKATSYVWGLGLAWAQSRLRPMVCWTSECDSQRRPQQPALNPPPE